jgi:hypothetical protein
LMANWYKGAEAKEKQVHLTADRSKGLISQRGPKF